MRSVVLAAETETAYAGVGTAAGAIRTSALADVLRPAPSRTVIDIAYVPAVLYKCGAVGLNPSSVAPSPKPHAYWMGAVPLRTLAKKEPAFCGVPPLAVNVTDSGPPSVGSGGVGDGDGEGVC